MEVDRNSDKYLYPAEVKYIVMILSILLPGFMKRKRPEHSFRTLSYVIG